MRVYLCRTCGQPIGITGVPENLPPGTYTVDMEVGLECASCSKEKEQRVKMKAAQSPPNS